ncbi:hypothetical protein [Acetoanaerobium noterae]|uniref:hypothetical protein n=1 Tax=Acetoanaerobium noterae TaxID=745369 RepID=UPI0028AC12C8|nr:hypothetical protein [Acetoanaerobium noterae]
MEKRYCEEYGREDLLGEIIMLTPQTFEYDNGLYTEYQESAGIYNEEEGEPESIYHLFGNKLENILDCELIPATEEDLEIINKMIGAKRLEMEKEADDFIRFIQEEQIKEKDFLLI